MILDYMAIFEVMVEMFFFSIVRITGMSPYDTLIALMFAIIMVTASHYLTILRGIFHSMPYMKDDLKALWKNKTS
jgi:hypothetical protein